MGDLNNSITVWIALDDADADTGVVEYISGTHKIPHERLQKLLEEYGGFHDDTKTQTASGKKKILQQKVREIGREMGIDKDGFGDVVRPTIPAGCCVIHHQNVLHGSSANRSTTRHRRALVVHLIDGSVQFVEEPTYIYGRYKLRDS